MSMQDCLGKKYERTDGAYSVQVLAINETTQRVMLKVLGDDPKLKGKPFDMDFREFHVSFDELEEPYQGEWQWAEGFGPEDLEEKDREPF